MGQEEQTRVVPLLNMEQIRAPGGPNTAIYSPPTTPLMQQHAQFPSAAKEAITTPTVVAPASPLGYLLTPVTPRNVDELSVGPTKRLNLLAELELSKWEVPGLEWSGNEQLVGSGSNSNVYCSEVLDVVLKVPLSKLKNKIMRQELMTMAQLQQEIGCVSDGTTRWPFIKFFGIKYLGDERLCLVLERLESDLQHYLDGCGVVAAGAGSEIFIGRERWWNLYLDLKLALAELRLLDIVHCDLKTSNILVHGDHFKVCDFSSAKSIEDSSLDPETTLQFLAPELLHLGNKSNHNFSTDLYSAGLILLHAATGRQPYEDYLSSSMIRLMTMIKGNMVLEVLDLHSVHILRQNPDIYAILKRILVQRCDLDEL